MIKVSEILVLILSVCSVNCINARPQIVAVDENNAKGPIDDSLYNLLDNLRYSLRCGLPRMPPLAPFVIQSAEIDEGGFLYNIQGNVRDLTVSGLDGYTVDTATLNILTLRISIGLTFPKVSLSTFYDLDALLLRFLPIYGHGRMYLDVKDFSVQGNGRLSLNIFTGRLNLTTLDIGLGMGSIYSDTTGIYNSRIVSTLFNIAFEKTLRDIFESNKLKIEDELRNLLLPIANQYLNELTLQDLLNLITGGSESGGPHLDDETGELICESNEDATTSATEQTSSEPTNYYPDDDKEEIESTTRLDPDDESNSSNFLFNKFQVMILSGATIICLRIS